MSTYAGGVTRGAENSIMDMTGIFPALVRFQSYRIGYVYSEEILFLSRDIFVYLGLNFILLGIIGLFLMKKKFKVHFLCFP